MDYMIIQVQNMIHSNDHLRETPRKQPSDDNTIIFFFIKKTSRNATGDVHDISLQIGAAGWMDIAALQCKKDKW